MVTYCFQGIYNFNEESKLDNILGEIAYHMARAAKKKEVSTLRLDMFVLIFGIYCCLNSVALIVFGIELIVGRRKAKNKINVNATSVKDDLGSENSRPF